MLETLVRVKTNLAKYKLNSDVHAYNTRTKNNLFVIPHSTNLYKEGFINTGLHMYNELPMYSSGKKKTGPTRVADFRAVFTAEHPYLFLGPETTYAVEQ